MKRKKTYFQSLKSIFAESPQVFISNQFNSQKYDKVNHLGKLDDYVSDYLIV